MSTVRQIASTGLTALLLATAFDLNAQDIAFTPNVLPPREQWLAELDRMPMQALETTFLFCDRESRARMLSFDDGVRCAMAWDVLLKRGFRGNVDSLIAWWQIHRDATRAK